MSNKIFFDDPKVGKKEAKYIHKAISAGYVSSVGPFISDFEKIFKKRLGANGAVATQSGTSAIHMALNELEIRSNDEVIVPELTFVATINPILYQGATPVIVDVDPKTWTIDPKCIEAAITKKTKAIIPVHLYGNPCQMDEICKIAQRHHIAVIEDATESLGAQYKENYTGTIGDFGCFSFNGNKTITTGSGGMITGHDRNRLNHIKFLINQAKDDTRDFYHTEIGFNLRMTNIEAALGLAQMEQLDRFLKIRNDFYNVYKSELENLPNVNFQESYPSSNPAFWLVGIMFDKTVNVKKLKQELNNVSIPSRRIFTPLTQLPPYKKYKKSDLSNANNIYHNGLCLPGSTLNTIKNIKYVCKKLKELL